MTLRDAEVVRDADLSQEDDAVVVERGDAFIQSIRSFGHGLLVVMVWLGEFGVLGEDFLVGCFLEHGPLDGVIEAVEVEAVEVEAVGEAQFAELGVGEEGVGLLSACPTEEDVAGDFGAVLEDDGVGFEMGDVFAVGIDVFSDGVPEVFVLEKAYCTAAPVCPFERLATSS